MRRREKKKHPKTSPMESTRQQLQSVTRAEYIRKLHDFDSALCNARAVSQAQAGRYTDINIGYGTRVFAKICSHATAMIRAAPLSRWISSESENWDFNCVAGHARAILEGSLLFNNLMKKPSSEDELRARIDILNLNDCTRRIELMQDVGGAHSVLQEQRRDLQTRLQKNKYFQSLSSSTKTRCLQGKNITIETRDHGLAEIGFSKKAFDGIFDLLSQHTHILPLSFYRMEPNGRGTGVENNTDRNYIALSLGICSELLNLATDKVVAQFPDIADVRMGVDSKFSHGPVSNKPIPKELNKSKQNNSNSFTLKENKINNAIGLAWPQPPLLRVGSRILVSADADRLRYSRCD